MIQSGVLSNKSRKVDNVETKVPENYAPPRLILQH